MAGKASSAPEDGAKAQQSPFLTVFTLDRTHKSYSYSSFAAKLHFRLRHGGVPYETDTGTRGEAPKSKIPYVRFEEDLTAPAAAAIGDGDGDGAGEDGSVSVRRGELMGDSALVTARLVALGKLPDLDKGLTPAERARDFCLRSMVEERLYYFLIWERWFENGKVMRDEGPFSYMPWGVRHVACFFIKSFFVRLMLYFQGTGRHSREELMKLRREAVGALADSARAGFEAASKKRKRSGEEGAEAEAEAEVTAGKPFWILGGEEPTEADFAVFGYLSGILACKPNEFTRELIKEQPELMAYVKDIHVRYFPDFENPLHASWAT